MIFISPMTRNLRLIPLIISAALFAQPQPTPEPSAKPAPLTLVTWSDANPLVGHISQGGVSDQGISFTIQGQIIPRLVPWFDVRSLSDETRIQSHAPFAMTARRAHQRIQRGDFKGARKLYASLGEKYLGGSGPQSADISLGLLLCALAEQDRPRAVEAWVNWIIATAPRQGDAAAPGYDEKYMIFTGLPPVFGPRSDGREIKMDMPETLPDRGRALLGYAALAMDQAAHRTPEALSRLDELDAILRGREFRDFGAELMADMLLAQAHPEPEKRAAARAALDRRTRSSAGTWIEVWARLGIGVSLIAEDDFPSQERGVIELIHIIVRLRDIEPGLARLASEIADQYLRRTDRDRWGARLMFEASKMIHPESTRSFTQGAPGA